MLTLTYTIALFLFVVFTSVGCTVPAIIAALVFLGLLGRELFNDLKRWSHHPLLRG